MEAARATARHRAHIINAFNAVEEDDEEKLHQALARGVDVNLSSDRRAEDDEFTLLTYAAYIGCERMCKALLAAGADPNRIDGGGDAPLDLACYRHGAGARAKTLSEIIACVRCLLEANADVNQRTVNRSMRSGDIVLHMAVETMAEENVGKTIGLIQLLLSHGANIEAKNGTGMTPLAKALFYGVKPTVLFLLRAGACVKVLKHDDVLQQNKALNDYLIEIVNDGGWAARARRHRDRCLGVVSRCNRRLPRDVALSVVSFWSLPH
jgi:ankyrin repeat protein